MVEEGEDEDANCPEKVVETRDIAAALAATLPARPRLPEGCFQPSSDASNEGNDEDDANKDNVDPDLPLAAEPPREEPTLAAPSPKPPPGAAELEFAENVDDGNKGPPAEDSETPPRPPGALEAAAEKAEVEFRCPPPFLSPPAPRAATAA